MRVVIEILWAIAAVTLVNTVWETTSRLYLRRRARTALAAAPDWGMRMQEAAERHISAVSDAYFREENGEQDVESPAAAPYDGCDTCMIREILAGAWPVMAEMLDYHHRNRLDLHLRAGSHDA